MLDEAVIYGISMCGKRDINEAEKDLQTVSIQARYITWSQKTQRKTTWKDRELHTDLEGAQATPRYPNPSI